MSIPPPPAPGEPRLPPPGTIRCPRCSAPIGPEQDWCLECGAPARTRLAQTPNWQLPTVAIGAIVLIAGAMLAFAFVKLTEDDGPAPAATATTAATTALPPAVVPPATTTTAPLTATTPATTTPTTTTPPATTTTATTATTPTTTAPQATTAPRTTSTTTTIPRTTTTATTTPSTKTTESGRTVTTP